MPLLLLAALYFSQDVIDLRICYSIIQQALWVHGGDLATVAEGRMSAS